MFSLKRFHTCEAVGAHKWKQRRGKPQPCLSGVLGGLRGQWGSLCQSSKSLEETEPLAYKMVIFVCEANSSIRSLEGDFLGDSMVTNLQMQETWLIPDSGRSHIPRATKPAQLLSLGGSHNYWSVHTLQLVLCNKAIPMRSPLSATSKWPLLSATREKSLCSNEDPVQTKIKVNKLKTKARKVLLFLQNRDCAYC